MINTKKMAGVLITTPCSGILTASQSPTWVGPLFDVVHGKKEEG
jgi:hypothetical protein